MSNEYYIVQENDTTGPYDIVALVVKIRNRSLTRESILTRSDTAEARPAEEWQELKLFFMELEARKEEIVAVQANEKKKDLFSYLKNGVFFLQQNMISTVFSGVFVLSIIAILGLINVLVPVQVHSFFYVLGFIAIQCMFGSYMLMILRMQRGQPLHKEYFNDKIRNNLGKLVRISTLISFPITIGIILLTFFNDVNAAMVGLVIIIVPGIYIMTIYSFAPLLVLDKGYEVWEAMQTSRNYILKRGAETFGIYFALMAINFIGALLIIFPLVLTLPVTLSGIAESYDEAFS